MRTHDKKIGRLKGTWNKIPKMKDRPTEITIHNFSSPKFIRGRKASFII